jgi:hypothetical protein
VSESISTNSHYAQSSDRHLRFFVMISSTTASVVIHRPSPILLASSMDRRDTITYHSSGSQQFHKISITFLAGPAREDSNIVGSYRTPTHVSAPASAVAQTLHRRFEPFGASIITVEIRSPSRDTGQRVPLPTNHHSTTKCIRRLSHQIVRSLINRSGRGRTRGPMV